MHIDEILTDFSQHACRVYAVVDARASAVCRLDLLARSSSTMETADDSRQMHCNPLWQPEGSSRLGSQRASNAHQAYQRIQG